MKSMFWPKCKNMLLIFDFAANITSVGRGRLLPLTLSSRMAPLLVGSKQEVFPVDSLWWQKTTPSAFLES